MKRIYICIIALAVSVAIINVTGIMHEIKSEKRMDALQHQCDSLQRQIDFMVE